jgi:hypothetical protein
MARARAENERMRKTFAWVLGFAAAAGAMGCGDDGGKTSAGSPGPASNAATPVANKGKEDAAKTPAAAPAKPAAPASADAKSAVGRWSADMAPLIAMMKPMLEMAVKMAESMAPAGGAESADAKKKQDEAKKKLADLDKVKMVLDLSKDGSAAMDVAMAGDAPEKVLGSWTQTGDQVTVTMKTSNGKAVEGRKAEPRTFTLKDDVMTMSEGPMTITFKRQ